MLIGYGENVSFLILNSVADGNFLMLFDNQAALPATCKTAKFVFICIVRNSEVG